MNKHTPGPWRYEAGGGHAPNRIVGSESIQVGGWPEPRGDVVNAIYSDVVCESLGNIELPGPAANARLIAAAPDMLEALRRINANGYTSIADHDMVLAVINKATGESE